MGTKLAGSVAREAVVTGDQLWGRSGPARAAEGRSPDWFRLRSVFGHEVEAVMEGEFDVFGETFSFDGPDQGEMVG